MKTQGLAETFILHVCIGTTGRLGICTHIEKHEGTYRAAGFGLDGKGVWTSTSPHSLGTAEEFYTLLKKRFGGKLSWYG